MTRGILDILNLGGGVQSSRLLEESIAGDLPRLHAAIFADTGWEPRPVYEHVEYLTEKSLLAGIPVYRVQAGDLRSDALRSQVYGGKMGLDAAAVVEASGVPRRRWASMPLYTCRVWWPIAEDIELLQGAIAVFEEKTSSEDVDYSQFLWVPEDEDDDWGKREASKLRKILAHLKNGKPVEQRGMIKRQCTKEYKIEPIESFIKTDILGLEPSARWPKEMCVRQWFGISLDEMQRCRTSSQKWKSHWYSLVERRITRSACYSWFTERGLPVPPRSACKGCPFHHDDEWRAMRQRPEDWEDACAFDDAIRKCGGMRGDCYLHRSCQPLRDVDLSTDVDRGQLLLPVVYDDIAEKECVTGHCFG